MRLGGTDATEEKHGSDETEKGGRLEVANLAPAAAARAAQVAIIVRLRLGLGSFCFFRVVGKLRVPKRQSAIRFERE